MDTFLYRYVEADPHTEQSVEIAAFTQLAINAVGALTTENDALKMQVEAAMRFIDHVAYDEWSAGELLQEAKAVIDQIGDGE